MLDQLPLDDATARRWSWMLMHIGTRDQLDRAALEIRALYAATAEQRQQNAAHLAKLRESFRLSAATLDRSDPRGGQRSR